MSAPGRRHRVQSSAQSNALVEGRYEPGEKLTIAGLAKELGVSITPVRETIFRLASEKALEMKAATAIHVPELTPDQMREIQRIGEAPPSHMS